MNKRGFSLLLAVGMLIVSASAAGRRDQFPMMGAQGETVLTVSSPETLPAAGETFVVTVEISGNPGFNAVQFTVQSDSGAAACIAAQLGDLLSGSLAETNPDAHTGAILAAANMQAITGNGTLGVFTYRVAEEGDVAFSLTDALLADETGKDIPFTVQTRKVESSAETPAIGQAGDGMGGTEPPEVELEETQPETETTSEEAEETASAEETQAETETETASASSSETGAASDDQAAESSSDNQTVSSSAAESELQDTQNTETAETPVNPFPDVPETHWAKAYIDKAVRAGLFQGFPDGTFRPDENVTRSQFVTVLWRSAGRTQPSAAVPFNDMGGVSEEFAQAAAWGAEMQYVTGVQNADGSFSFQPTGSITREQAMTILFRRDGASGPDQTVSTSYDTRFSDSGLISSYAKDAMYWAVEKGYINGTTSTTLTPQGNATRAQLAKILVGYLDDAQKKEAS